MTADDIVKLMSAPAVPARAKHSLDKPILGMPPTTILIDTREQRPYTFKDLLPFGVAVKRATLPTGDYSLAGHTEAAASPDTLSFAVPGVAIERKSYADLCQSITRGRRRFERELQRLAAYGTAAVVVEADWESISYNPDPKWWRRDDEHERAEHAPSAHHNFARTIFRSVIAWQQRYPAIAWWFVPSRAFAEVAVLAILRRCASNFAGDEMCSRGKMASLWPAAARGKKGGGMSDTPAPTNTLPRATR